MPKLKTYQPNRLKNVIPSKNGKADPIKLDLSHGDLPNAEYIRKDISKLADESVSEVYSAYTLNRIPGPERLKWMSEVWRVLVPQGKITVIVPYWSSPRSIQDPCAAWPPLCEQSFLYFNKEFRTMNKCEFKGDCDFDFVYGYALDQETANKEDNVRSFWIKHYLNTANDLQLTLTKRPKTSPLRT